MPRHITFLACLLFTVLCMTSALAGPPGDFDGDGDVDRADYLSFAQAWRQAHAPGGSAPPQYDLAGDGRLGHNSAAIFLGSWLTSELAAPTDPFDGAVAYSGVWPPIGAVSYPTDGGTRVASAFQGQVIVQFKTAMASATAQGLFATYGGTTRAQIPGLGIFLVGVPVGGESAFIGHMRADSRVYQAIPHFVGRRAGTEVVVIDNCGGTHADKVEKVLTDRGVTVTQCRDDDSGGGAVVRMSTLWEVEKAISDQKGGPILINISSYVGYAGDTDYDDEAPESQKNVLSKHTEDRIALLKAIAALPAEYRQNLVVTLAAGNDHMPLDDVFEKIVADPKLAEVLRDNILFVGSKGQSFSNYSASNSSHFVWVNNTEASEGTSFAAPYALAVISKIMVTRGLSATEALLVAKAAANANASHELLESDVLPPLYKATMSGETTDSVEGSVWRAAVNLNLSVVIGGSGTVGDPYRVAMSFDGSLVETLIVCADPPCDPGGTTPVNGTGLQNSTGKVAGSATGLEGNFTVTLTDGTFNADRSKLTGTVTVDSPFFDAPITKTVTFNKGS